MHAGTGDLAALKTIFHFVLGPPSPRGVRTVTSVRKSEVLSRSRPGSGGERIYNFDLGFKLECQAAWRMLVTRRAGLNAHLFSFKPIENNNEK